jgi:anti-anti-sigma regulatory factor
MNKEQILEKWVSSSNLDLEEVEIRLQYAKLLEIILKTMENENTDTLIEDFVENITKYEITPKEIVESLMNLIDILEDNKYIKSIYAVGFKVYEEFNNTKNRLIQKQIETIKQMDIPILKMDSDTILVPLIGFLDSEKSITLIRKILQTIRKEETLKVILDIEGIPVIDTEVANQFLKLYRAIKIIGAKLIISGITPAVAETMVHLDIDLPIPTRANLELAIKAFRDEEI